MGLQIFLSMRRIEARCKNAGALQVRFSQSLASLRHRLSHAKVLIDGGGGRASPRWVCSRHLTSRDASHKVRVEYLPMCRRRSTGRESRESVPFGPRPSGSQAADSRSTECPRGRPYLTHHHRPLAAAALARSNERFNQLPFGLGQIARGRTARGSSPSTSVTPLELGHLPYVSGTISMFRDGRIFPRAKAARAQQTARRPRSR
jgi:hypothetical protein